MDGQTESAEERKRRLTEEARRQIAEGREAQRAAEEQSRRERAAFALPGALAPSATEERAAAMFAPEEPSDDAAQRARVRALAGPEKPGLLSSVVEGAAAPFRAAASNLAPIAKAIMPGALSTGGPVARMENPVDTNAPIAGRDTGTDAPDWYSRLGQDPQGGGAGQVGSLFGGDTMAYAAQVKGPEYKMSEELKQAYDEQRGGYEQLQKKTDEFLKNPEREKLLTKAEEARRAYAADEEERFGRTKQISKRAEGMEAEAKRVAGLKIDPEAMMGQGAARARTTLALSVANVLGNVGQAMQGKAATDAVLGIVRDMISQNVEQQQKDRQFELQGLQARQTALGRTADMLNNERAAGLAVLSGQLDWYKSQLERIARPMADEQARNVITQAIGKVQEAKGNVDQQLMNATESGRFQADMANAQMSTSAAIQRANARVSQATAVAQAGGQGLSEGDARMLNEAILKPALDKKLGQRYELLQALEAFARDPANRDAMKAMSGFVNTMREAVGRDADAGAFRTYFANKSAEQFTDPRERQLFELFREYSASKMGGQAGKAITGIEAFLYRPGQIFDLPSLMQTIEAEHRYNIQEKLGLAQILPSMQPGAARRGVEALERIYPSRLRPAPQAPAQPGPVRTPAR